MALWGTGHLTVQPPHRCQPRTANEDWLLIAESRESQVPAELRLPTRGVPNLRGGATDAAGHGKAAAAIVCRLPRPWSVPKRRGHVPARCWSLAHEGVQGAAEKSYAGTGQDGDL